MACCEGTKFKLTYFDARAKAETIRFMFAYKNVPYEDVRIALPVGGNDEWAKAKPTMPLRQVPVLDVKCKDGTCGESMLICESAVIIRALARWFSLEGKTECERIRAEETLECMRELCHTAQMALWASPDQQQAMRTKIKTVLVPTYFGYLEKLVQANGGRNIAGGDSYTYADFEVATTLEWLRLCKEKLDSDELAFDYAAIEATYPGLAALKKAVEAVPAIKEYLAKRPVTFG